MDLPILYSFRRCPYAMRARLALIIAGTSVELREVKLSNKPQQLIDASAKATVPVLLLTDGTVLEESLDIMNWAYQQMAPSESEKWFWQIDHPLIVDNDLKFKPLLDRYKYSERYQEGLTQQDYQKQSLPYLLNLEERLNKTSFLLGFEPSFIDLALFPFIRQFAHVDQDWFFNTSYNKLQRWLEHWKKSSLFEVAMKKYPTWHIDQEKTIF